MLSILISNNNNGRSKLLEVMDVSISQTEVIVSQVYTQLQTHQVEHMKYVQLFVCKSYFNKVVKKEKILMVWQILNNSKNIIIKYCHLTLKG